jgi:hypothetical protein
MRYQLSLFDLAPVSESSKTENAQPMRSRFAPPGLLSYMYE